MTASRRIPSSLACLGNKADLSGPFTLSVEPVGGPSFVHGYHLGTIEGIARNIAAGMFHGRNEGGLHTCTVALIRGGRIFDVYDGKWSSEYAKEEW